MSTKTKLSLIAISVLLAVTIGVASMEEEDKSSDAMMDLDLTNEQLEQLSELGAEYNKRQFDIALDITGKYYELEIELKRRDRFETEQKAAAAAERVNVIIKKVSQMYGELLKTRVEYMLKAKDVLTPEQRIKLIRSLDYDMKMPANISYYQKVNIMDVGIDLTADQMKKILRYRTDTKIDHLKIRLEIKYNVIDLEEEIAKDEPDSDKVNELVMEIVELGTQMLDNQINHFIKAKDVLTLEQKKEILHKIMMMN